MSKSLARKYGRDGVLINSVLPGLIHTAMWERAAGKIAETSNSTTEQVLANNGKSVPVGRYGTSEEVAALVVFLCSEAASYINGTAIEVDGEPGQPRVEAVGSHHNEGLRFYSGLGMANKLGCNSIVMGTSFGGA